MAKMVAYVLLMVVLFATIMRSTIVEGRELIELASDTTEGAYVSETQYDGEEKDGKKANHHEKPPKKQHHHEKPPKKQHHHEKPPKKHPHHGVDKPPQP